MSLEPQRLIKCKKVCCIYLLILRWLQTQQVSPDRIALNSHDSALACLDPQQTCSTHCIPQSANLHKKATTYIQIIYTI